MKFDNIIFIIGCGHSGTTILNKIMSNHKNIYGFNYETAILTISDEIAVKNLITFDKDRKNISKKWICEKTPIHVYQLTRMYKLVNKPKIIIAIRDGRDVVASLFKRYNNFNKSVNRWIDDNLQWINYYNLKNNSNLYNNENFHIIKYESFVSSPTLEIKKICEFIGEEYDENIFNYKKEQINIPKKLFEKQIEGNNHNLLRLYQINQDIYDGTGRYLKDLTKDQLKELYSNEKFIYLMNFFGYL